MQMIKLAIWRNIRHISGNNLLQSFCGRIYLMKDVCFISLSIEFVNELISHKTFVCR